MVHLLACALTGGSLLDEGLILTFRLYLSFNIRTTLGLDICHRRLKKETDLQKRIFDRLYFDFLCIGTETLIL